MALTVQQHRGYLGLQVNRERSRGPLVWVVLADQYTEVGDPRVTRVRGSWVWVS